MTRFITPGPMPATGDRASPLDPVLTGVAQGLARLFPAVEPARVQETPAQATSAPAQRQDGDRSAVWVGFRTRSRGADGSKV